MKGGDFMGYLDSTGLAYYDGKIKDYIDSRSAAGSTIVSVSGTTPTIAADAGSVYVCGELTSLNFTPPSTGVTTVVFTSGSTATELTLPSTVKMPDWFVMEANRVYEISITLGQYGSVMSWAV